MTKLLTIQFWKSAYGDVTKGPYTAPRWLTDPSASKAGVGSALSDLLAFVRFQTNRRSNKEPVLTQEAWRPQTEG